MTTSDVGLLCFASFILGAFVSSIVFDRFTDKLLNYFDENGLLEDLNDHDMEVLKSIRKLEEKKMI